MEHGGQNFSVSCCRKQVPNLGGKADEAKLMREAGILTAIEMIGTSLESTN